MNAVGPVDDRERADILAYIRTQHFDAPYPDLAEEGMRELVTKELAGQNPEQPIVLTREGRYALIGLLGNYDAAVNRQVAEFWWGRRGVARLELGPFREPRIYVIRQGVNGPYKIGLSTNPRRRLAQLQTSSPALLTVEAVFAGDRNVEQSLHSRFAASRLEGEWFAESTDLLEWLTEVRRQHAAEA